MSLLGVEKVWGELGFGWLFAGVEGCFPFSPPKPVNQEAVFTMPGRAGRQSYGTERDRA